LSAGRLRLRSGSATLAFLTGVTLTLEAPADLDLVAIDRVFCRQGRLRAHVPHGAEGFVVASPLSAVADLGTDFALNIGDDGKSQVMVFEGLAQAALLGGAGGTEHSRFLRKSESIELDTRAGRISDAVARPASFVPAPDLHPPRLILDPSYADAVLESRPQGYWRFETQDGDFVRNQVAGGPPLRIAGPVVLSDGPGDNRCAVFKPGAPEQYLTVDSTWELAREPGQAIELWFMAEEYGYVSLVGLYPSQELNPPGLAHSYLHVLLVEALARGTHPFHKPPSIRFLYRWPLHMAVQDNLYSGRVYAPRRWHHVVAQMSGGQMELFFDGEISRAVPLVPDRPTLPCRLIVGRRTPDAGDPKDSRSFVGRLDELALYDHTLSPGEIRDHFRRATITSGPD
jgi:hypothetical protein